MIYKVHVSYNIQGTFEIMSEQICANKICDSPREIQA